MQPRTWCHERLKPRCASRRTRSRCRGCPARRTTHCWTSCWSSRCTPWRCLPSVRASLTVTTPLLSTGTSRTTRVAAARDAETYFGRVAQRSKCSSSRGRGRPRGQRCRAGACRQGHHELCPGSHDVHIKLNTPSSKLVSQEKAFDELVADKAWEYKRNRDRVSEIWSLVDRQRAELTSCSTGEGVERHARLSDAAAAAGRTRLRMLLPEGGTSTRSEVARAWAPGAAQNMSGFAELCCRPARLRSYPILAVGGRVYATSFNLNFVVRAREVVPVDPPGTPTVTCTGRTIAPWPSAPRRARPLTVPLRLPCGSCTPPTQ